MGLTAFSDNLLNEYLKDGDSICELGNQTLFFGKDYGKSAKPYFEKRGFNHVSIDLNGLDGALKLDLQKPIDLGPFDIVTDFGTSEHVSDVYLCWKNKHSLCKSNGIIISENPKTGNWPGHGRHYYTLEFYKKLASVCSYKILVLGENPAHGNTKNGWNIHCVLRKLNNSPFISKEIFDSLDLRQE